MSPERLQKVLAAAGVASRRESERLISAGRVTVDGRVATLGEQVDPATVAIAVDGRPIGGPVAPVHLLLHKPLGVTSTARDRHAERTVLEVVPPELRPSGVRLFPVGRLDRDSEGLIVLTNDGEWADRVLHPRHGIEREYAVGIRVALTPEQLRRLGEGIRLEEGLARVSHFRAATPVEIRQMADLLDPRPEPGLTWYRATLAHGWKRQVRRMFAAVGVPVARLVRVRIGPVRLGALAAGDVRRLEPREVRLLGAGTTTNPGAAPSPTRREDHPAPDA